MASQRKWALQMWSGMAGYKERVPRRDKKAEGARTGKQVGVRFERASNSVLQG